MNPLFDKGRSIVEVRNIIIVFYSLTCGTSLIQQFVHMLFRNTTLVILHKVCIIYGNKRKSKNINGSLML